MAEEDPTPPLPPAEAATFAAGLVANIGPERALAIVRRLEQAAESYRRRQQPVAAQNQALLAAAFLAAIRQRAH
jgi:hypothetical protein